MAKHYSIKSFFRDTPAALLGRYFHKRELFQNFDFASMKGADRETLFTEWRNLPDDERRSMEAEFQEILFMSRDAAMPPIIHEAAWHMRDDPAAHAAFVEMFSSLSNNHERAMLTFLDYHECWKGANLFHHADTLPHWRKRTGFPHKPAAVDERSVKQLADVIGDFFHRTEGRGKDCRVDCLRRVGLDYFFAYPADYSRQANEWIDGELAPRPHTPAFEIVYIYSQQDGSLDLNFRGDYKRAEVVQEIFAETILGLSSLPPVERRRAVYRLDDFANPFAFSFDPDSGVRRVSVKLLRLSSKVVTGDRITIEANSGDDNPNAVYELLAKLAHSVDLRDYNVTRVELTASVVLKAGGKPHTVPISLTHPCFCSLKYDDLGLKLRDMLSASGIEPKEPTGSLEP